MKSQLLEISLNVYKVGPPPDIVEHTKLVNLISLIGVPISIVYISLFSLTDHVSLALAFAAGLVVFILPPFLNKWFGLNFGRYFISIMGSIVFGSVNIIAGPEAGFYLGFLVISIPPIIIYPDLKRGIIFVIITSLFLVLTIFGNMKMEPICPVVGDYAMCLYVFNLFTVLVASITVIVIFKTELAKSRAQLEEKNNEIVASITYAKRIQYTLLAHDSFLKENLTEHFVFFKPKDIVSGDFYWATKRENKFYLAVCDCTGHGVPGAFMSLLNITFLNEAINEKNISEPHEILNHVRKQLIESISKEGGRDGMDAILLCIEGNKITYAAANNSPILLKNNQLLTLETDKMPVGRGEKLDSFNLRTIDAVSGDTIYLYTDGYADQFGGPNGKKFKYKVLNKLLVENSTKSFLEQQKLLATELTNWQGDLEQIDDVCVIGVRL